MSSPLSLPDWTSQPPRNSVRLLYLVRYSVWVQDRLQSPLPFAIGLFKHGNPEVIHNHLAREVSLGRMFTPRQQSNVHISHLGIIPKKNKPGKWQLIVDLSSPRAQACMTSVSSLRYPTVDDLASLIVRSGRGPSL